MGGRPHRATHAWGLWLVTLIGCVLVGLSLGFHVPLSFPTRQTPPRIALIIDDCGYHDTTFAVLQTLPAPVTVAVLPHLPYSQRIAELETRMPLEVMLHVPLEPEPGTVPQGRLEAHTLTTRMSATELRQRLREALASVPHVRGLNNHMGSQFTQDARAMTALLEEVKQQDLYFVDSLVTPASVAERVAQRLDVQFAKRAIFLDNVNEAEAIRAQLRALARVAHRHGAAIGIGHDRSLTLTVIREMIPELEAQGIRLVHVSALVSEERD